MRNSPTIYWFLIPNYLKIAKKYHPDKVIHLGEEHQKGASDTYFQKETDRCENYTFDYKKTNIANKQKEQNALFL